MQCSNFHVSVECPVTVYIKIIIYNDCKKVDRQKECFSSPQYEKGEEANCTRQGKVH